MPDIGIVAVAVNIEERIIDRFRQDLAESTERTHDVYIVISDKYMENGLLNKSRALNDAIRNLSDNTDIIVTTDIDMLIPPGLLDYTVGCLLPGKDLWVVCRNIFEKDIEPRRWHDWMGLPLRKSGHGSWNAMYAEDWLKHGGYDERLTGWGAEDDVFLKRRAEAGIGLMIAENFPLMHVNHPSRQNKEETQRDNQHNKRLGMSGERVNWLE